MSRSSQPTFPQLCNALGNLARCVAEHHEWSAENGRYVREGLRSIISHLQHFIPGLDPPPDPERAYQSFRTSQSALLWGHERQVFGTALEGLSFAPHDSRLWYVGATAAFDLGEVELAILMLYHILWINPGHKAARDDLEALTTFFEGAEGDDS